MSDVIYDESIVESDYDRLTEHMDKARIMFKKQQNEEKGPDMFALNKQIAAFRNNVGALTREFAEFKVGYNIPVDEINLHYENVGHIAKRERPTGYSGSSASELCSELSKKMKGSIITLNNGKDQALKIELAINKLIRDSEEIARTVQLINGISEAD